MDWIWYIYLRGIFFSFLYTKILDTDNTFSFLFLFFFFGEYSWQLDNISKLGWVTLFYLIITLSKKIKHIYTLQDLNTGLYVHASLFTCSIYISYNISHIYFALFLLFTYLLCSFSVIVENPRTEFNNYTHGEDYFMHVLFRLNYNLPLTKMDWKFSFIRFKKLI
jgi:hypothetical protein